MAEKGSRKDKGEAAYAVLYNYIDLLSKDRLIKITKFMLRTLPKCSVTKNTLYRMYLKGLYTF